MTGNRLIFASLIYPGQEAQTNGLLLAESLRTFARNLSQAPIWFLHPEVGRPFPDSFKDHLHALDVTLIPVRVDSEIMNFPLACDPVAAAYAETLAVDQAELLVWQGANTVVLAEPLDFILPDVFDLGVRPVHHTLIGSRFDQPPDSFWEWIYEACDVPNGHIFPMTTHVDATTIRPYINAGAFVTRPELGLLKGWSREFQDLYQSDFLLDYYERDWRYKIFIHQVVLTATILAILPPDRIKILPDTYNYPLHLYWEDVSDHRPSCLDQLVTFRHEGFYKDPDWRGQIPASDALVRWLTDRLPDDI